MLCWVIVDVEEENNATQFSSAGVLIISCKLCQNYKSLSEHSHSRETRIKNDAKLLESRKPHQAK